MNTDITRYGDALRLLAEGHIFDAVGFARSVLAGGSADAAWAADVAAMNAPRNADEQAEVDRAYRTSVARRKVVRAALNVVSATTGGAVAQTAAYARLDAAVAAFRDAGGNEAIG